MNRHAHHLPRHSLVGLPLVRLLLPAAALAGALAATGCADTRPLRESRDLWSQGRVEQSVQTLREASALHPGDLPLKTAYEHQRELALAQLSIAADRARGMRDYAQARALYEGALRLDPAYPRAREGLDQIESLKRQDDKLEKARKRLAAGDGPGAQVLLDEVLAENPAHPQARQLLGALRRQQALSDHPAPTLKSLLNRPITLDLRDTPLRSVFEAVSQTAGLNFVFDRDVHTESKVTIFIRNSSIEDVLKLVLSTNALERKILNENTVLIYPNTAVKQREYQELVLRTFYLTNADIKQVQSLLKSMAHTKEMYADEKLNMVAVRDTPDAVRLAEHLVDAVDVPDAEVMLEVEVLEISRTRAQTLGLQFPTQAVRAAGSGAAIATRQLGQTITTITNPVLIADLFAQDVDADLLANPRIRVKNKEKAKVLIGEKLPVVTSTAVQNAGVSTSVSYIDVGLKLEVEPQVYLDDEVGIKINLEVNSNLGSVSESGTTAYDVGTRSATTVLRLHDGETQVLAGLINDNERHTLSKIPGLGDIPGIGRLFTDDKASREKTEVVLLITPRIIRNIVPPEDGALMMAAGTEAAPGGPPLAIGPTPLSSLVVGASAPAQSSRSPGPASAATSGSQDGDGPGGGDAGGAPAAPPGSPLAAPSALAPGVPPAVAALAPPSNLAATVGAPEEASLGGTFTVSVELTGAGSAVDGDVVLGFDPSLLQAAGPSSGRASVHLGKTAPDTLFGVASFKALAAGAGSVGITFVEGHARLPDGSLPALSGNSVTVKIGL